MIFRLLNNSNPLYRILDPDGDYALRSRARNTLYDGYGRASYITGTANGNYEIAAGEFAPLLEKTRELKALFDNIDKRVEASGGPLIPCRLPGLKKRQITSTALLLSWVVVQIGSIIKKQIR